MRKSNNYYKFMEYVSYGKRYDNTICKDNGVLECTSYCTVSDIENVCGDCSHFNACMQDYETNASMCCMFDSSNKAIKNPEWHHVSLATLANIDFDMLDKKRQLYLKLYRELKELIQDLHKCKSGHSYERRLARMYIRNGELVDENKVSHDYINYFTRKISMCNVECGLWTSKVEEATGLHESRRYSRPTLKY